MQPGFPRAAWFVVCFQGGQERAVSGRLVGAWGFGEYWLELVGVMFNGSRDDAEWRVGEGEIYACFHKFVGMPVL